MLDNKSYTNQVEKGKPRILEAEIKTKDVTGSTHYTTVQVYFDKEKATQEKILKDIKTKVKEELKEKDFTERFGNLLSTDKIVSLKTKKLRTFKQL